MIGIAPWFQTEDWHEYERLDPEVNAEDRYRRFGEAMSMILRNTFTRDGIACMIIPGSATV